MIKIGKRRICVVHGYVQMDYINGKPVNLQLSA